MSNRRKTAVVETPVASTRRQTPRRRLGPALDERELMQVHRRYRQLILLRCRRILRDEHAAEDATQMVFLKLWRYGDSFRCADSQLYWLCRVADRCCFDELKRRSRCCSDDAIDAKAAATRLADPVEDRDLVRQFLGRLDDRVQQIAVLRHCQEMSQDEIAAETRWSRQTVFKKLVLVRKRARALRASLCGDDTSTQDRLVSGAWTKKARANAPK
jgi:RNA polymerase sigma-70 factor (ECF subfamily)